MRKHQTYILIACLSIILTNLIGKANAHSNLFKHIQFIENQGQWQDNIQYQAELPNARIYAETGKFTYLLLNGEDVDRIHDLHHNPKQATSASDFLIHCHAFSVTFEGANEHVTLEKSCQSTVKRNYYIGKETEKWASSVAAYQQLDYREIYDGIDLRLYSMDGNVKYDFMVAPQADPTQIKLQYEGLDDLYTKNGNLYLVNSVNTIIEKQPYTYQIIDGQTVVVSSHFKVTDRSVTFQFSEGYNPDYELIIDPELIFSTYSGSTTDNWGFTATYDSEGHLYAGSVSFGAGYPTTLGAFQVDFAGGEVGNYAPTDIAISKFSPDGSQLLYSTYIGGIDGNELPHSLIVNSENELIIFGTTGSNDYPASANAYDRTFNGGNELVVNAISFPNGSDIILSKLNADGSQLLASTYIGGAGNDGLVSQETALYHNYADEARGEVFLDAEENILFASSTQSNNFPTTLNAYQSLYGGGVQDACLVKMNSDLSERIWATFLGGEGDDAAYSVKVADDGAIFIAGGTNSQNFPNTANALNPTFHGGAVDGFISKLSEDGRSLLSSSFLGTNEYDQAYFIEIDLAQSVYVLGQTAGDYPTQNAVYNQPNSGQFIHKLSNDLSQTEFSMLFGKGDSNPDISPTAFLVDTCGQIYVSGWGGSTGGGAEGFTTIDLPTTKDAEFNESDGNDFYFLVLGENASSLEYASFFGDINPAVGGEHVDGGTSRFDKNGVIYQAICAGCGGNDNFPTTEGAWSNDNNASNCNLGAVKLALTGVTADFTAERVGCDEPLTVVLENNSSNANDFFWDFGDGNTAEGSQTQHTYPTSGQYTVTMVAIKNTNSCFLTDTVQQNIVVIDIPKNIHISPAQFCVGDTAVQLMADVPNGIWSGMGIVNSATGLFDPSELEAGEYVISYMVSNNVGCSLTQDTTITISEIPDADFAPLSANYCAFSTEVVPLIPNVTGGIFTGLGIDNNQFIPANVPADFLDVPIEISYEITVNGCKNQSTQTVTVISSPDVNFVLGDALFCADEDVNINLADFVAIGGGMFSGIGVKNNIFNPANVPAEQWDEAVLLTYLLNIDDCDVMDTQTIFVFSLSDANFAPLQAEYCGINHDTIPLTANELDGVFSGTGVVELGSNTYAFLPANVPAELHGQPIEISYEITTNICTNRSSQVTSVFVPDDPSFVIPNLCPNDPPFLVDTTNSQWQSELFGDTFGQIDPSVLEAGTYAITHITGKENCILTATETIEIYEVLDVFLVQEPSCLNNGTDLFCFTLAADGTTNEEDLLSLTLNENITIEVAPFEEFNIDTIFCQDGNNDDSFITLNFINNVTGCMTMLEVERINCPDCMPDAGLMSSQDLQIACAEDTVFAQTIDPTLEVGQVLAYILHNNSIAETGNILASNFTGEFTVADAPELEFYTEYYISAIVGFPDENGFPITHDNCTVINAGAPVLFLAPISIVTDEFCERPSLNYHVTFAIEGGYPSYDSTAVYTISGDFLGQLAHGETATFILESGETAYNLVVENDGFGCAPDTLQKGFVCNKTPSELLTFRGEVLPAGNLLKWITATETNTNYFDLQKSTDAQEFKSIGNIKAAGTTDITQNYEFLDQNPSSGWQYYRFVQYDLDGTQTFSRIVALEREELNFAISSQNSVVDNQLQILLQIPPNTKQLSVQLFNSVGQQVYAQLLLQPNTLVSHSINTGNLPAGIYFLSVFDGKKKLVEKIVIP